MSTSWNDRSSYVTSDSSSSTNNQTRLVWDDAIKFAKNCFAGAFAAVVAKLVIAPFERVKLLLQLQNSQTTLAVEKRYKGVLDCFMRVPKEQGFLSLWRGNGVNIFRSCCQESLGFAFKDFFKIWSLDAVAPLPPSSLHTAHFLICGGFLYTFDTTHLGNLVAGGCSGAATMVIIYPLEFIRTRLAIDLGKDRKDREFTGMFDCARKIMKQDGFAGMYRGLLPSIQYIIIYRGAYYGLFDSAKPYISKDGDALSFWRAFTAGQVVTLIAAMLSYPLDTIRRRLMMAAGHKNFMYKGTIDCTKYIYVNEGWKAFFNGALVNAMRGTGAALVLAVCNEFAKYM
uniref:ADP/ATP translocase n=1 Tax=Angiostrongylus cantonensis TaxID=6313 RepID=A0A0K0DL56_ANGCA